MPKKKLPEPLVGWKDDNDWSWRFSEGHWIRRRKKDCHQFNVLPAALCPLPRLPRKGERVECRIVLMKKKENV